MSPTQDSPDKKAGRQRSNQLGKHQGQDEPSDLVTIPRMPNRKTDFRDFPKNRIDDNSIRINMAKSMLKACSFKNSRTKLISFGKVD
jgi:hypothetical protein